MQILSIGGNNQLSCKAVNQKLVNRAIRTRLKNLPLHDQTSLINEIAYKTACGIYTYRDSIDTLEAIRPYSENSLDTLESMIDRMKHIYEHLNGRK